MNHVIESPLGRVTGDPISIALGTDIRRFRSPTGIHGQFWMEGRNLHLLTVMSERRGAFRDFIGQCKDYYPQICIWQIFNPWLPKVLKRYGFEPATHLHLGENITGMRWEKPP